MDCSLPGSSIHGILQARILEWGAIVLGTKYINIYKYIKQSPSDRELTALQDSLLDL